MRNHLLVLGPDHGSRRPWLGSSLVYLSQRFHNWRKFPSKLPSLQWEGSVLIVNVIQSFHFPLIRREPYANNLWKPWPPLVYNGNGTCLDLVSQSPRNIVLEFLRTSYHHKHPNGENVHINSDIKGRFPLRKIILGSDRIGTKFNLHMRLWCQFFAHFEAILYLWTAYLKPTENCL